MVQSFCTPRGQRPRRNEIDFASRFPPRHLETCRPEISKLDLGTIKNGSAASDLPPEGPKKKSWADLTHLAHISKLALGTIKNGSAVSDLPPGDPKKNVGLI